jgi:hypothetical protein
MEYINFQSILYSWIPRLYPRYSVFYCENFKMHIQDIQSFTVNISKPTTKDTQSFTVSIPKCISEIISFHLGVQGVACKAIPWLGEG